MIHSYDMFLVYNMSLLFTLYENYEKKEKKNMMNVHSTSLFYSYQRFTRPQQHVSLLHPARGGVAADPGQHRGLGRGPVAAAEGVVLGIRRQQCYPEPSPPQQLGHDPRGLPHSRPYWLHRTCGSSYIIMIQLLNAL